MRQNDTKRAKYGGVGRWLAIGLLVLALVGVAIAWGVTNGQARARANSLQDSLESTYRQTYYQLTYSLSNLADSLDKLQVAASPSMQMQLLGQANTYAVQATTALCGVGRETEVQATTKCLNQAGDYCLRLQYSLAQGGSIQADQRDTLQSLYRAICRIEQSLAAMENDVEQDGFSFITALDSPGALGGNLAEFEAEAVSYPALIYDGPFSDALDTSAPLGLGETLLTEAQARQLVEVYLPYRGRISPQGMLSGRIEAYCYQVETDVGTYWLSIAKQGGALVTMGCDATPQDTVYGVDEAEAYGRQYLAAIGLTDMQAVWVSNYNSIYYINYAYTQQDVVCYSDLVVLKVDAQTKRLVGVEALNYLYNHTRRHIPAPSVSRASALAAVHAQLQVDNVRLALIPTDGGREKLTYEIHGRMGGDQYFVYVDAQTGQECKIMRVVDSGSGELLV